MDGEKKGERKGDMYIPYINILLSVDYISIFMSLSE